MTADELEEREGDKPDEEEPEAACEYCGLYWPLSSLRRDIDVRICPLCLADGRAGQCRRQEAQEPAPESMRPLLDWCARIETRRALARHAATEET